ncbi:hypothetical protein DFH07DRAFT_861561 [Mycena maculata]|uniref:Uncharacterized protein n=1 Tax=Mycena maculata TaxID=230809 RepID=A0AAD7HBT7_9AGAR|nr:hypothetical protein DFH07DRAFT_861561 [Mycena maculata]
MADRSRPGRDSPGVFITSVVSLYQAFTSTGGDIHSIIQQAQTLRVLSLLPTHPHLNPNPSPTTLDGTFISSPDSTTASTSPPHASPASSSTTVSALSESLSSPLASSPPPAPSATPSADVSGPTSTALQSAGRSRSNDALIIVASVLAPVLLICLAVVGVLLYKRRLRARDRREWERTHEEIADAVRQAGTPTNDWVRSRLSDTKSEFLPEKGGSDTDPLFYKFPPDWVVSGARGTSRSLPHSPASSLS